MSEESIEKAAMPLLELSEAPARLKIGYLSLLVEPTNLRSSVPKLLQLPRLTCEPLAYRTFFDGRAHS